MRITLTDPFTARDLTRYLREQRAAVVTERSRTEIEVSILGSYTGMAMGEALLDALRDWRGERKHTPTGPIIDVLV